MDWTGFIKTLGQSLSYPAFWVGFVLVVLFAHSRFAASEAEAEDCDPRVISRSFTTRFRYGLSAIAYIVLFEVCYGLLVGIGSLPFLQDLLTKWIGSLEIPAQGEEPVGTPAWAALFVTAVLPSAPGFSTVERQFRKILHNFASIPHKARGLAQEILDNLPPETLYSLDDTYQVGSSDENAAVKLQVAKVSWLFRSIDKLKDSTSGGNRTEAYKKFFETDYLSIWNGLKQKDAQLGELSNTSENVATVVASEREALLTTTARFLSCALLFNESSERDARSVIRDRLGIERLPKLKFDFKLEQIVINFLLAFVLTFVSSLIALGLALPDGWIGISGKMLGAIVFWLPFTAVTMVVPFVFAAGVRLYFMDRMQAAKTIPFEDQLLALILLFLFTYCVGVIPTFLGMVSSNYQLTEYWVMQVLPSGMTPAVIALLFYFLSCRHLVKSKLLAVVLDTSIFAITAAFLSWLAVKVAIRAELDVQNMMSIEGITNEILLVVSPVIHAVMVGVIGAIQCSISRINLDITDEPAPVIAGEERHT